MKIKEKLSCTSKKDINRYYVAALHEVYMNTRQ